MENNHGWVIELALPAGGEPMFWASPNRWTPEPSQAIRFARELDAQRVSASTGRSSVAREVER
jgi:hypothetical protein